MVRQSVRQSDKDAALLHLPPGSRHPGRVPSGSDAASDARLESETFVSETAEVRELPQMREMCEMRETGRGHPQSPPGGAQGRNYSGGESRGR